MAPRVRIPIEIPYGLSLFALIFVSSITTNWTMYRTCYITLGRNQSDCALLGSGNSSNSTAELEKEVQPYVTVITMVNSTFQAAIAAIVCFFLGPWSDKYGRKPVLLLSFAGYALAFAIMAVISAISYLSPWFVLLTALPSGLTGGFIAQITVGLCYITDITTVSSRGMRLAILETTLTTGSLAGTLSSSYVFYYCGYTIMYIIASSCFAISWLMIFFFIPESIKNVQTTGKISSFFQISLFKRSLNATFRKRSDHRRAILLTAISILIIYSLAFSEYNFTFLYLRKMFNWSLRQFTIFSGGTTVTFILGSLIGVYILHTVLKVNESTMILFGLLSGFNSTLVMGFATDNWYIYASGGLKFLSGAVSPMARTLVSKMALEDSGAVFSFIAVCETLTVLIASFIYTFIYNETISSVSSILYFFIAGIYLIGIFVSIGLIALQRRKSLALEYNRIENEVG